MRSEDQLPHRLTCATSGYQVDADGALLFHLPPLEVSLQFHPSDPLALQLRARSEHAEIAVVFAIELLEEGLFGATGVGDVHLHPQGRFVVITVDGQDSFFSIALPAGAVLELIDRAHHLIGPEDTGAAVSQALEAEMAELFGEPPMQ